VFTFRDSGVAGYLIAGQELPDGEIRKLPNVGAE
jgi:hypothetical protein